MARKSKSKIEIKDYIESNFQYDLYKSYDQIREGYQFDETCPGSVPQAIIAFLESTDFEDAIRKAVWLKGDADTQAAIAGSIAEAYYKGVPEVLKEKVIELLPPEFVEILQSIK